MEQCLPKRLQSYITAELKDASLYRELSRLAPCDGDKKLLLEFAVDEECHAEEFKKIYRSITGKCFNPEIEPIEIKDKYRSVLKERVFDESGDFRKYGEQYIQTQKNTALSRAYYRARTDENVHALRLLAMLTNI